MFLSTKLLISAVAIAGQWPLIAALDSPTSPQQRPLAINDDNIGAAAAEESDGDGEGDEDWDDLMAEGGKNPLTRDFRRKVVRWLGQWHVPGLAVGVVDGEDIWTQVSSGVFFFPRDGDVWDVDE